MVRKSRFLCVFYGFLKGSALDPLAPGQSKRSFPLSTCRPILCCLSYDFVDIILLQIWANNRHDYYVIFSDAVLMIFLMNELID